MSCWTLQWKNGWSEIQVKKQNQSHMFLLDRNLRPFVSLLLVITERILNALLSSNASTRGQRRSKTLNKNNKRGKARSVSLSLWTGKVKTPVVSHLLLKFHRCWIFFLVSYGRLAWLIGYTAPPRFPVVLLCFLCFAHIGNLIADFAQRGPVHFCERNLRWV